MGGEGMRIRVGDDWIAGHPDYDPAVWSSADEVMFLPSRGGGWQAGAGFVRVQYEDTGNPAFGLRFTVFRTFPNQQAVADWITRLHGRTPPHAWAGVVTLRLDDAVEGAVEMDCGECVISLAGPVRSLGETGRLTQVIPYFIQAGVMGEQPVRLEPEVPDQEDIIEPPGGGFS
jgi:hypothetical protein